jgi:lipid-binding SYLF domain-containing protein
MQSTPRWFAAAAAALLILPAPLRAQDVDDEIDRLTESMAVLRELSRPSDQGIPADILAGAEAVVVIPDMLRGGFIVGGKHGRGVVSVRDRATGGWSPPAFVAMTGGSVGWQIGAESVDLVLFVMNPNGVQRLLDNQFTLGGALSATAGPVGRSAGASTDVSLGSQILAYSRTRGLFAGATLEGVSLRADDDANEEFYGRELDLEEIMIRRAPNSRAPLIVTQWADLMRAIAGRGDAPAGGWGTTRQAPAPPADQAGWGTRRTVSERVNLAAIIEDPDAFEGRSVTITAPVEAVFSPTLFSVDDDPARSTRRDVIVINPQPVDQVTRDGTVVITGIVYRFDRRDLERRLVGWRWDVSDEVLRSFDDRPVIVADSIRSTGRELVSPTGARGGWSGDARIDDRPALPPASFTGRLVTVDELLEDADDFYGRQVMITAEVEDVYSRSAFAIDDDRLLSTGRDVLVIAPGIRRPVADDLDVTIVGEVVEFDRGDIEDRLAGYRLDLRDDLVRAFDNRPVILATSIRTREGEELVVR